MKYPDIDKFEMNDRYFEEIFQNIWLMDNHKWAYYIWENFSSQKMPQIPSVLFHLDYHWDGVNDFRDSSTIKKLIDIKKVESIHDLVLEDEYIRKDSFISPAIIRGLVNEIHFYCKQNDRERLRLYPEWSKTEFRIQS